MTWLLRRLVRAELACAVALGAAGDWWAASAVRRLEKFSGERS